MCPALSTNGSHKLSAEGLRQPPQSGDTQTDRHCTDPNAAVRLHQTFKLCELVRGSVVSEIASKSRILSANRSDKPSLGRREGLRSQERFEPARPTGRRDSLREPISSNLQTRAKTGNHCPDARQSSASEHSLSGLKPDVKQYQFGV